jgi:poly(3-hydroxybutyrate) depolymerase
MVVATALLAGALSLPAPAATAIPAGEASFEFVDAKGRADRPVRVFTYRPAQCDAKCPLQFVMHGKGRTAQNYRRYWKGAADRHGFIVVAPEFSTRQWPGDEAYNLGDVAAQPDREKWSYSLIEHLFDEIRDGREDYRIFGHSAGAQFVHRFVFLLPGNRAAAAVAANAGRYAMPEWRKDKAAFPWPDSLAGSPAGEQELRQALARKVYVMVGEKDVDPNHRDLDRSAGPMAQGANRVERGRSFFKASGDAAQELGVKFAWELAIVPGSAHSGSKMSLAAAELVYGTRR